MTRATPVLFALALVACRPDANDHGIADKTVSVASDDAEMAEARAHAKRTLPEFWKIVERPEHGEEAAAIKVRITDGIESEHFWLKEPRKQDGKVHGTIDNEPEFVHHVKLGQDIAVGEDEVEDWTYVKGAKMYGNFTLRPLLKKMPPDEAAKLRAALAEP